MHRQKPSLAVVPSTKADGSLLDPLVPRHTRLVSSPAQLWDLFEIYQSDCEDKEKPLTLAGTILALGFSSREAFNGYGHRPEYKEVVDRIRLAIEAEYEHRLHGPAAAGAIKWLSVHAGYTERLNIGNPTGERFEVEHSSQEDELELLRRVGFLFAKRAADAMTIEGKAEPAESTEGSPDGE